MFDEQHPEDQQADDATLAELAERYEDIRRNDSTVAAALQAGRAAGMTTEDILRCAIVALVHEKNYYAKKLVAVRIRADATSYRDRMKDMRARFIKDIVVATTPEPDDYDDEDGERPAVDPAPYARNTIPIATIKGTWPPFTPSPALRAALRDGMPDATDVPIE